MAHAAVADLTLPLRARAVREAEAVRLDWRAFSVTFFPGRRLHDLEVLKAYEAYVDGRPLLTGEQAKADDAVPVWENEGGAIPCRR